MRAIIVSGALLSGAGASAGCVDRVITQVDTGIADVGGEDVADDIGDASEDAGDDVGDDVAPEPVCPQLQLGASVPVSIVVDTVGQADDVALECVPTGAGDVAVGWVAPFDGPFLAYTSGSSFDPALQLRDGGCDGPALACVDDASGVEAVVSFGALAGQTFTFVVDGEGTTTLVVEAVEAGPCPDGDLGDALPVAIGDDSFGAPDRFGSSCGGVGGSDRQYTFIAPTDGLFGLEVAASFDPVLYVQDGVCLPAELACNHDLPGTSFAGLGVELVAGQAVTVGVDAADVGGPFTLLVDRVQTEGCPALFLGGEWPVGAGGSTSRNLDTAGSSCGGWATPDETWVWTAPESGTWQVTMSEATFDWVLSVFDGDCDGELLGCRNAYESGGPGAPVVVQLESGQSIAIAVDGIAGATGDYAFTIDRFEGCDAIPLPQDPPVSIVASTAGEPAMHAGSCAPTDRSPEMVFQMVPPASGPYRMHTAGASYDTVLYVRAGDCTGPELACNDDGPQDITSELVVDLVAGQPVYVFVDGYGGDAGPFQLEIEPL